MPRPRILTFNWHETYLHTLASIGGAWEIVPRLKGGRLDWWREVRPLPENMHVVAEADALDRARAGGYDVAVCHNLLDLGQVADTGVPTITIFHTSRDLELAHGLDAAAFDARGRLLLAGTRTVFVSAMKQQSWNVPGQVIPPGVDCDAYGGWRGEVSRVLHVGNLKRELSNTNGMPELEDASAGLPFTLIGLNPGIPGARLSRDWEDLRETMRAHRVYLHTTRAPFEDGYNLAMLEAMATGMPVVTLQHPTSPIVDRQNGLVGRTALELRLALLELLEDSALAARLGAAGRETVRERFPIAAFRQRWTTLLQLSAEMDSSG